MILVFERRSLTQNHATSLPMILTPKWDPGFDPKFGGGGEKLQIKTQGWSSSLGLCTSLGGHRALYQAVCNNKGPLSCLIRIIFFPFSSVLDPYFPTHSHSRTIQRNSGLVLLLRTTGTVTDTLMITQRWVNLFTCLRSNVDGRCDPYLVGCSAFPLTSYLKVISGSLPYEVSSGVWLINSPCSMISQ